MSKRIRLLDKAVSHITQMAMLDIRVELKRFDGVLTEDELLYIKQQLTAVGEIEEGNEAPYFENLDDIHQIIYEFIRQRNDLISFD